MKTLISVWCCLMMLMPAIASAQGTNAHKTREQLERERFIHVRMAQCTQKAQDSRLQPGTTDFNTFIANCMRG
jgi:hypothetical protein